MRAVGLVFLLATGLTAAGAAEPLAVRSDTGRFTLRVTGLERPEPLNHLHGLDLALTTSDGKAVTGAAIVVTGMRRSSPNPLPTLPQVAPAPGDGNYRVEGLRFHMPGEWRLVFDIEFAQIRDRAALDVAVK